MSVRNIAPTDTIEVKHLCALVYGQPGSRKTSLVQTADEPVTLAFDEGIYRCHGRRQSAIFETWTDVVGYDTGPYRTVNVDTVGRCLSLLGQALIADNPKNGNRLGGLSLQGYGQLAIRFEAWVDGLKSRGKDLVFVAQEKAEKNGDEYYYCPDIVGKSYNIVMELCDVVGYMHFDSGRRVIDFTPTDRWMAKSPPCGWSQFQLPDFSSNPHFLANLLDDAKASMGRISEESARMAEAVAGWQKRFETEPGLDALNEWSQALADMPQAQKVQVWHLFTTYADKVGFVFEKKAKRFTKKGAA